jgi:hypothetical protein
MANLQGRGLQRRVHPGEPEIVGYVTDDDERYCAECWAALAARGSRPLKLMTTEVGEARGTFRIIDDCQQCSGKIDYQDIALLA